MGDALVIQLPGSGFHHFGDVAAAIHGEDDVAEVGQGAVEIVGAGGRPVVGMAVEDAEYLESFFGREALGLQEVFGRHAEAAQLVFTGAVVDFEGHVDAALVRTVQAEQKAAAFARVGAGAVAFHGALDFVAPPKRQGLGVGLVRTGHEVAGRFAEVPEGRPSLGIGGCAGHGFRKVGP